MFDQSTGCLAALDTSAGRQRVTIIHNPASGRGNRRRLLRHAQAMAACGMSVTVRRTRGFGDARLIAACLTIGSTDLLAIAGGDGTINEVINGLPCDSLPLAVLPFGTANVLAAELGVTGNPSRLARALAAHTSTRVHVPTANGRRFAMMVGIGFDAHVVAAVDHRLKRLLGKAAYVTAYFETLWRFPYQGYEVLVDGETYTAASVVIANGRYYGGRFTCAPDARLQDPDLQVCLFLRTGRWSAVRYGLSLLLGRLHRRSDVKILRARHVEVRGAAGEPVQCDGDIGTCLPLDVHAGEETLRFVTLPPCGR